MNGRDFLAVARALATGGGEANQRSALSRAYYAAFHAASDLLSDVGFAVPRADRAHNYLYVRLNNSGSGPVRTAAEFLHDLRGRRNHADYDVRKPFPPNSAATAIAEARQIIQTLDALTQGERAQIAGVMKVYEQGIGDVTWHR